MSFAAQNPNLVGALSSAGGPGSRSIIGNSSMSGSTQVIVMTQDANGNLTPLSPMGGSSQPQIMMMGSTSSGRLISLPQETMTNSAGNYNSSGGGPSAHQGTVNVVGAPVSFPGTTSNADRDSRNGTATGVTTGGTSGTRPGVITSSMIMNPGGIGMTGPGGAGATSGSGPGGGRYDSAAGGGPGMTTITRPVDPATSNDPPNPPNTAGSASRSGSPSGTTGTNNVFVSVD